MALEKKVKRKNLWRFQYHRVLVEVVVVEEDHRIFSPEVEEIVI